ncbi:hypothetical protein AB0M28_33805 [Streptomyces sp. NPDC051940]|uniref:hypothetical protein n=1 Tax=Streptomyces sp. NPDC051940 TaxID=3155675 RepID=UPI00341FE328
MTSLENGTFDYFSPCVVHRLGGTVMSEPARNRCPDCGRIYYERGPAHMIEAARVPEERYLAEEFLSALATSKKSSDRNRLADVLICLEFYSCGGSLEYPREINDLRDGIREFKIGDVRLPFFDVPDSSTDALRLTHGFLKKQQQAPREQIDKAIWVRREDLAS